jgi:2-dehydropantoate 2-reductase
VKITIVGAGAVGSLLGALLSSRHDVTLIGRAWHMEPIARSGLRVQARAPFTVHPKTATSAVGLSAPDLVLLTVKAFDTEAALAGMTPLMGASTILVSVQNGLGNWEQAQAAYPRHAVLAATLTYGASIPEPGVVAWNGTGEVVLGGTRARHEVVQRVAQALAATELTVRTTDNVAGALWLKAIVNAAINPLTAIHRVPNGALIEDAALRQRMKRVCDEALRVARAQGVRLPVEDPSTEAERIARLTATNRSSMLQSVERGLPTEIDQITGAILRAAKIHGIPCPENQSLYDAVRGLRAGTAVG